ncbi:MAG: U32 family peptidase [Lachnospiraceae bacterium]|nr:U32 family peptidase [Lachnospiraceae bacterium]
MKHELLAPAGNLNIFYAVINAGADAVYVGGPKFSARAYAKNFTEEELITAITYAHLHQVKVYMTVNTLIKNSEMDECIQMMIPFYEAGLDGVIVQDVGVLAAFKKHFPGMELHSSTQMSVSNVYGAKLMKEAGVCRVVPSRELSLKEIQRIHEEAEIEIESFIHGALCYSYSGQCLLSSVIGGRSGNRGRCAGPCRLPYEVLDQYHKRILKSSNILSLKDLCTINFLPKLLDAGIYSLKIEGRMKQASYAYTVVSIYRKYLDYYEKYGGKNYKVSKEDYETLIQSGNRDGFTDGYYMKHNGKDMITSSTAAHNSSQGELDESILIKPKQLPVSGSVFLYKNQPAMLQLTYNDTVIAVEGGMVEQAKSAGLTKEKIEKQLNKTGSSMFYFKELFCETEDDCFLPVSELNNLRRLAMENLTKELCNRRSYAKPSDQEFLEPKTFTGGISALISSADQFFEVLAKDYIRRIYVDFFAMNSEDMATLKEFIASNNVVDKEIYFALPYILRANNERLLRNYMDEFLPFLSGVLVRSYDELGFVKDYGLNIVSDASLYSFSDVSKKQLMDFGVAQTTIPYELSEKEILHRDNSASELQVFGRIPVMITAGCLKKNTLKCDHKSEKFYLKDRKGYEFMARNECQSCLNIIYNSKPTCFFNKPYEAVCDCMRLSFTMESKEETKNVLSLFEKNVLQLPVQAASLNDFTWGHYKKGVE